MKREGYIQIAGIIMCISVLMGTSAVMAQGMTHSPVIDGDTISSDNHSGTADQIQTPFMSAEDIRQNADALPEADHIVRMERTFNQLTIMIRECSKAVSWLYKQRNSGAITQHDFSSAMYGENGYDRLRLALITRKDALNRNMQIKEAAEREEHGPLWRARDRSLAVNAQTWNPENGGYVRSNNARIMQSPKHLGARTLRRLHLGDQVEIIEGAVGDPGWIKVRTQSGVEGWMYGNTLRESPFESVPGYMRPVQRRYSENVGIGAKG